MSTRVISTPNAQLLRATLLTNAGFSALSGVTFVLAAQPLESFLGWPNAGVIAGLGVGLLGFAFYVLYHAFRPNAGRVRGIIVLDVAWVLSSAALLLGAPLSAGGRWAVGSVAAIVALLALMQHRGLSGLRGGVSSFSISVCIEAPVSAVWRVLADIGTIERWHPGVKRSRATNDTRGLGGSRHCDLAAGSYLDEEVIVWKPEHRLTMRVGDTNLPFKEAETRFTLEPERSGTRVRVSPRYTLKYGLFGRLLDALYVRRSYHKGMRALLGGLRRHVEAGGR
jgi:uncharacterized protein YndB with AHSA1/START domain